MVDVQTSELDAKLESVNVTVIFCMLMDLQRMNNFNEINFAGKQNKNI
jgi:hypothetical protein